MIFIGISRIFSTLNDAQYESIGAFWDELSAEYGRNNLRGLGFNWTDSSIEYIIGLKNGIIENANAEIELPDDGWTVVCGRTVDLSKIYDAIYSDGTLLYEIEMFDDNGSCRIMYRR